MGTIELKTLNRTLALIALAWDIICTTWSSQSCFCQLFVQLTWNCSVLSAPLLSSLVLIWGNLLIGVITLCCCKFLFAYFSVSTYCTFVILYFCYFYLHYSFLALRNFGVTCAICFLIIFCPSCIQRFVSLPRKRWTPTMFSLMWDTRPFQNKCIIR